MSMGAYETRRASRPRPKEVDLTFHLLGRISKFLDGLATFKEGSDPAARPA
jgi:hypothetical protein